MTSSHVPQLPVTSGLGTWLDVTWQWQRRAWRGQQGGARRRERWWRGNKPEMFYPWSKLDLNHYINHEEQDNNEDGRDDSGVNDDDEPLSRLGRHQWCRLGSLDRLCNLQLPTFKHHPFWWWWWWYTTDYASQCWWWGERGLKREWGWLKTILSASDDRWFLQRRWLTNHERDGWWWFTMETWEWRRAAKRRDRPEKDFLLISPRLLFLLQTFKFH